MPHEAVTLRSCASGSGRGVVDRDCRLVLSSAGAMLKRAVCALAAHDAIEVSRFRGDPSVCNKRTGVSGLVWDECRPACCLGWATDYTRMLH